MVEDTLQVWHQLVQSKNASGLDELLAEDVVFHSPIIHTPQEGKELTKMYLTAAFKTFGNDTFTYVREVVSDSNAVLEFSVEIKGITINGVDIISWGKDGRITEFKVMLRPLKAINLMHDLMKAMLKN